jgi:hypothetical protein
MNNRRGDGMKVGKKFLWILAFLIPVLAVASGQARVADVSEGSRKCLLCHGKKGIVKTFLNEETVEAYVNPEKIRTSVHNFLTCSECHSDFSPGAHPSGKYKSRSQFRLRMSSICRRCHSAAKIKAKPVHATLLKREKEGESPVCTNCHDAHFVVPTSGGNVFSGEKQYCQNCHAHKLSMKFRNEEKMSVQVDLSVLANSGVRTAITDIPRKSTRRSGSGAEGIMSSPLRKTAGDAISPITRRRWTAFTMTS